MAWLAGRLPPGGLEISFVEMGGEMFHRQRAFAASHRGHEWSNLWRYFEYFLART